jgi:5'-nucleotidase
MRILVTNDDGIHSPGLRILAEVASRFGDVRIVAPDLEQSSMAHAVTATRPLTQRRHVISKNLEAYRVNGTPADCVGLGTYIWGDVDVVFSGVNLGLNVGNAMWHSGTLAAAKQASLLGIRGIAFSTAEESDEASYSEIRPHLESVIARLLDHPELALVNVNIPKNPRGVVFTRQSVRHYHGHIERARDPYDRDIYWFVARPLESAEVGTDRWAVEQDLVSITPLRLDLTDHTALAGLIETSRAETDGLGPPVVAPAVERAPR